MKVELIRMTNVTDNPGLRNNPTFDSYAEELPLFAQCATALADDWQLEKLQDKFGSCAIDWLLLKGAALGRWLYATPDERPSNDIDVLVRYADLRHAAAAIEEIGYHQCWINRYEDKWCDVDWHLVYRHDKPGFKLVELHWELEEAGRGRSKSIEAMFADAYKFLYNGKHYQALSTVDAFLHGAFHAF
ncbi:MAG: nucleotidyltransferase family protein [Deltaproteobacteria bacterium]